ncbi:MAG: peptidyl-prolyl cis-trans isomerase [Cyclobacteriaceae bacterium]|jgi:CRISPR/Cas system-associated exonuclease Cas4 (RecB family)
MKAIPFIAITLISLMTGCDLIRVKNETSTQEPVRKAVARVNDAMLYLDELDGIATPDTSPVDSAARISAYINSWIRKQVLIQEAMRTIDINEAEVERKVLDYRYSLIGYEYQNYYIRQHLSDSIADAEIENYYRDHQDNFVLKQNILQGTFIKVPKGAPRTTRIKDLMYSKKDKEVKELASYCLSFSAAYHLSDSTWIEFDKLVANSPLAEIPNKVQFLKTYSFFETQDDDYLYFLKVDAYKISDNVSPIDFVREDIKNIILNRRKVELARKLEDEVYEKAAERKDFEIFDQ